MMCSTLLIRVSTRVSDSPLHAPLDTRNVGQTAADAYHDAASNPKACKERVDFSGQCFGLVSCASSVCPVAVIQYSVLACGLCGAVFSSNNCQLACPDQGQLTLDHRPIDVDALLMVSTAARSTSDAVEHTRRYTAYPFLELIAGGRRTASHVGDQLSIGLWDEAESMRQCSQGTTQ
jgi:hypothetical protein